MNSLRTTILFAIIVALAALGTSQAKRAPKKAAPQINANDVPSSSFWKAKYGDFEISQEGFPFNFVMPAV